MSFLVAFVFIFVTLGVIQAVLGLRAPELAGRWESVPHAVTGGELLVDAVAVIAVGILKGVFGTVGIVNAVVTPHADDDDGIVDFYDIHVFEESEIRGVEISPAAVVAISDPAAVECTGTESSDALYCFYEDLFDAEAEYRLVRQAEFFVNILELDVEYLSFNARRPMKRRVNEQKGLFDFYDAFFAEEEKFRRDGMMDMIFKELEITREFCAIRADEVMDFKAQLDHFLDQADEIEDSVMLEEDHEDEKAEVEEAEHEQEVENEEEHVREQEANKKQAAVVKNEEATQEEYAENKNEDEVVQKEEENHEENEQDHEQAVADEEEMTMMEKACHLILDMKQALIAMESKWRKAEFEKEELMKIQAQLIAEYQPFFVQGADIIHDEVTKHDDTNNIPLAG